MVKGLKHELTDDNFTTFTLLVYTVHLIISLQDSNYICFEMLSTQTSMYVQLNLLCMTTDIKTTHQQHDEND